MSSPIQVSDPNRAQNQQEFIEISIDPSQNEIDPRMREIAQERLRNIAG